MSTQVQLGKYNALKLVKLLNKVTHAKPCCPPVYYYCKPLCAFATSLPSIKGMTKVRPHGSESLCNVGRASSLASLCIEYSTQTFTDSYEHAKADIIVIIACRQYGKVIKCHSKRNFERLFGAAPQKSLWVMSR